MRHFIFFWRNNEALDFFIAGITFAGWKGFRWTVIFSVSEVSFETVAKVNGFIHVFANGEKCFSSSLFLKKKSAGESWQAVKLSSSPSVQQSTWAASSPALTGQFQTPEGPIVHAQYIFRNKSACFNAEITFPRLLRKQAQTLPYFFKIKQSASLLLQKKWSASLFLQKKMKCRIISTEKMLIFFWRNNEEPYFFLKE